MTSDTLNNEKSYDLRHIWIIYMTHIDASCLVWSGGIDYIELGCVTKLI